MKRASKAPETSSFIAKISSFFGLIKLAIVFKKEAKVKAEEGDLNEKTKLIRSKYAISKAQYEKAHSYFFTRSIKHIRKWRRLKPTAKTAIIAGIIGLTVVSSTSISLLFNERGRAADPERAFEQQIELLNKEISVSSAGAYTGVATTANMSYTPDFSGYFLYNSANFSNAKFYFESVLASSGGTAYVSLFTMAGAQVAGTEISTSSTANTRIRSAEITSNLVNGTDYRFKIKGSATVKFARIIVVQSSTTGISATETHNEIGSFNQYTNTSWDYDDDVNSYYAVKEHKSFYYDSSKFDGTVTTYFEATAGNYYAGYAVNLKLYDETAGADVSGSTITLDSATPGPACSSNPCPTKRARATVTLSTLHDYSIKVQTVGSFGFIQSAKVIIKQSGTVTKLQTRRQLSNYYTYSGGSYDYTSLGSKSYWDVNNWKTGSISLYAEAYARVADGDTGYNPVGRTLYTRVTAGGTAVSGTGLTFDRDFKRLRSSAFAPPSSTMDIDGEMKFVNPSSANPLYFSGSLYVVEMNLGVSEVVIGSITGQSANCKGGETCTINWTYTGAIDHLALYYSLDGGTNWMISVDSVPIGAAGTGSYGWTVPYIIQSPTAKIKFLGYDSGGSLLLNAVSANFIIDSGRGPKNIVQTIPMFSASYSGASAAYTAVDSAIVNFDPANYPGSTVFLEAVMSTSSAGSPAYIALSDSTQSSVYAQTEVSTTATTLTRVRSNPLSISGDYALMAKCAASQTLQSVNLIVVQSGQTITKTETVIELSGKHTMPAWQTSYVTLPVSRSYLYDSSKIDGTTQVYFEVTNKITNVYSRANLYRLYDKTSSAVITTVGIASMNLNRARSTALTLTTGHEYVVQVANPAGSDQLEVLNSARLIITQAGFANFETMVPLDTFSGTTGSTSYVTKSNNYLYEPDNWQGVKKKFYSEATVNSSAGTGYVDFTSAGTSITAAAVSSATAAITRVRSADITANMPATAQSLNTKWKVTAGTLTVNGSWIVIQASLGVNIGGTVSTLGAGKKVSASVNKGIPQSVTTTTGGVFLFNQVSIDANSFIVLYLDNETEKGNLITQSVDDATSLNGLTIYPNQVVISHQTAGPITNTLIVSGAFADSDVLFSGTGTTVTFTDGYELTVANSKSYVPGGTTNFASINIPGNGTLTLGANTVNISGSLTLSASSDMTYSSALVFNGSGTQIVSLAGGSLGAITHSGSGTLRMASGISLAGDFNNSAGVLDLNSQAVTVLANFVNSGTYGTNGTLIFGKTTGTQTLNAGGTGTNKSIPNLTHSGTGTLQLITTDLSVANNLINSAGTLDLNSRNTYVGGDWTNTATVTTGTATVTFNSGVNTQTILPGASSFYNVTINNATVGGVVFNAATTVTNTLTSTDSAVKKITFKAGANFAVKNLNLLGTVGSRLALTSTTTSVWNLTDLSGTLNVSYVTVSYSNASAVVGAPFSSDGGNNSNWSFVSEIQVTGLPANAKVNSSVSVTVILKDGAGGNVSSVLGNVTLAVNYGTITPTTLTNANFAGGSWAGNLVLDKVSRPADSNLTTITITNNSVNWNGTIRITPGDLADFIIDNPPASEMAVQTVFNNVSITAVDTWGNVKTDYTSNFYFSSNDGSAVLPYTSSTPYTFVALDSGQKTFAGPFKFMTPGLARTLVVTNGTISRQVSVKVNPGALGSFTYETAITETVAGQSFGPITVTAKDIYGNTKIDYIGQGWFSSSDVSASIVLPATNAARYTYIAGDAGVKVFDNFKLITAGAKTITFTSGVGGIADQVIPITVKPGALNNFAISGNPANTQANVAFTNPIVITAFDQYSNQKTDYLGSVYFSSTDTNAVFPYTSASKYTYLVGDNGSKSFPGSGFKYKTTTSKTLVVTDADASISSTVNVNVTPGVLASYTVLGAPGETPAGTVFNGVTVTALDDCGNIKTDYAGQVWFTTSDTNAGVLLPAKVTSKYTYSSGTGAHVFDGFNLMTTGAQTITLTNGTLTNVTNITVTPAALKNFLITTAVTQTMAGQNFGPITVTAIDTFDNIKTDYTGQAWFTSSDTNGAVVLPASSSSKFTYTSGEAGVKVFNNFRLITAGEQNVTLTNGQSGIDNQVIPVTVHPGALNRFSITGNPGSAQANVAIGGPITVTAYDQYDNQKTDYTGSVYFTSSDTNAVLPYLEASKYIYTTGSSKDNGAHAFTGFTLKTTGARTIVVQDSLASISSSINITVNPGVLASFIVTGNVPATIAAGQAFTSPTHNLTVTALDDCGNTKTDFTGPVWFETTDVSPSVSLPATVSAKYTYTAGAGQDNGVHIFAGNTFALISQTTTGHSISLLSDLGPSKTVIAGSGIRVTAGAFNHFSMEDYPVGPDQWATSGEDWSRTDSLGGNGAPYDVTVTARDVFENIKSDFTGPVWFSMQDGVVYTFANSDSESAYNFTSDGGAVRESKESAMDNGKHIFEAGNFMVSTSGSNITFKVNTTALSNSFNVKIKPGDVATFGVTYSNPFSAVGTQNDPFLEMVGTQQTSSVIVTAYDMAGNVKSDYLGQYYFTSSDPNAVLPYTENNKGSFADLDQGSRILTPANASPYFKYNTGGNQVISVFGQAANGSWVRGDSATFTISAHKPVNVSATAGHRQATLDWQNPSDQAVVKVAIYQSTNNGVLGTQVGLVDVSPNAFSQYNAVNLDNGSTYYFTLKAVVRTYNSNDFESIASDQVSATPADLAARNVSAVLLSDGRVKVDYSLRYTSEVSLQYYQVESRTWADASTANLTGNFGVGQFGSEAIDRHTLYWVAKNNYPNKYHSASEGFKVRIKVFVSQSTAYTPSSSFMLDTMPPANLSVVVDASKAETADLRITATENPGNNIQMMLSKNSEFNDASWQSYATAVNNWPLGSANTVYAKFIDSFSNQSTISVDVIPVVENFAIKDVSDTRIPAYQFFLSWGQSPINNVKNYLVERAVDDDNFSQVNQSAQLAFVDLGLTDQSFYSYRVKVEDQNGSISRPSFVLSSQPGLAPNVTSKPTVQVFGYKQEIGVKAILKWNTDQYADSFVAYSTEELKNVPGINTISGVSANIYGQLDRVLEHEVVLTGLQPGKKYYMKVLSQNDIKITGYSDVFTVETPAYTALEIKNLEMKDLTPDSVWVSWNTNKVSTTRLYYGIDNKYDRNMQDTTLNMDHTFKLENLEAGANYNLRVEASDEDGNKINSDSYSVNPPAKPVVVGVQYKDVTYHAATVTWETNVPCASTVEYGDSEKYGFQSSKSELVTKHEVNLIGLTDKIKYNFRVVSKDVYGNEAKSENKTFTTDHDTVAPLISGVQAQLSQVNTPQGLKYQAIISWSTDEGSTSQIEYGENSAGNYTKKTKEDLSLNMNHVVILSDLKPNSAFSYRVKSHDLSANEAVSANFTIVTPPQERSLVQIVLNSLSETFAWTAKLKARFIR